jgi:hypothetical protein
MVNGPGRGLDNLGAVGQSFDTSSTSNALGRSFSALKNFGNELFNKIQGIQSKQQESLSSFINSGLEKISHQFTKLGESVNKKNISNENPNHTERSFTHLKDADSNISPCAKKTFSEYKSVTVNKSKSSLFSKTITTVTVEKVKIDKESGKEVGPIITRTYVVGKKLGQGGFGAAYLLINQDKKGEVTDAKGNIQDTHYKNKVLKDFKLSAQKAGEQNPVLKGLNIHKELFNLKHTEGRENLAKAAKHTAVEEGKVTHSIMNAYNGDLESRGGIPRSFASALDMATQLTKGVGNMHKNDQVHHDLKPANMLYGTKDTVKDGKIVTVKNYVVGDFDGAHAANRSLTIYSKHYNENDIDDKLDNLYPKMSDEDKKKFNKATDIHQLGISLGELFMGGKKEDRNGEPLVNALKGDSYNLNRMQQAIEENLRCTKEQATGAMKLLGEMCSPDHTQRPDADAVMSRLNSLSLLL